MKQYNFEKRHGLQTGSREGKTHTPIRGKIGSIHRFLPRTIQGAELYFYPTEFSKQKLLKIGYPPPRVVVALKFSKSSLF
jgi:hypothetical protein